MKTGRNDPCPCGSGKKYKKCCDPIEQTTVQNTSLNQNKQNINNEDDILQKQELWLNALNSIQEFQY